MRWPSFTLVELLVVIAAVALLMAVLLPSLQSSKQQAKAILCGSNVKQLTFGLLVYETENKTLPYGFHVKCCDANDNPIEPPGGYPGNRVYDKAGWWWLNYISNDSYTDKNKRQVFWCPSRRINNAELNYVLHGNYGVNLSICKSPKGRRGRDEFVGMPLRSSKIPRPVETLLIVDSGYSTITWWHATDAPPSPLGNSIEDTAYIPGLRINSERDLWPGQEEDAIYGRHPHKTVNVGFVDGHIRRMKADDLLIEKIGDEYRNRSPLWAPK